MAIYVLSPSVFPLILQPIFVLFHQAYCRHLELSKGGDESLKSESFLECKSLSTRLSGIFVGAARNKHRPEILRIVKEGIEYAFQDAPKQLSFLEASVLHFASRLSVPDIRDM